jgi:DNA polymerase elongation subunit (family B)
MATVSQKKMGIRKMFRLFDFNVYDEDNSHAEVDYSDDSSEDGKYKYIKDEKNFVIQMFGVNEKGETCCLYVEDYKPFFFVKVGDNWMEYDKRCFVDELKQKLGKMFQDSIIEATLVNHHKLYGFSGGKKHKFIKLVFKNITSMNKTKNLWFDYVVDKRSGENVRRRTNLISKKTEIELYESNIPPLLRYFHVNSVSPSGWVSFNTARMIKPPINTTTCKYEYKCSLKDLTPMPEKETRVPYKICSFDIEASSSHGDFPIPIKTYKRFATNLVDVFLRQLQFLDIQNSLSLLQKCVLASFGFGKFDDIDRVYPKSRVTTEFIQSKIDVLVKIPIEKAKDEHMNDETSQLLQIDKIFDKINKEYQTQFESGDSDELEPSNNDESNEYGYMSYEKKIKTNKKSTIIDVLLSDKYDREEKIQLTNEVITLMFPPLEGDKVTFIGSTFMKYGELEPYMNHCVVLGTCDDVNGTIIETAKTEKDLLLQWAKLIQDENPDIMIGYNIFGFDYEFMFRRAQENKCERDFLKLSRKVNELCAKEDRHTRQLNIENTKMQIASGDYDLRYFKMTGRLQIDMYAYFRRDFNLSSYKLDDVAGQYISDSIKKVVCCTHPEYGNVTELYSKNLTGLHKNDYIHIEFSGVTSNYYKNGKKFKVLDIEFNREVIENDKTNIFNIIIINNHETALENAKSIKWGTAKDDVTPQDIFRLANGSSTDRAVVAKYCIQDCNLVHHLLNKIDVITGFTEMASICSVPIDFLIFRGQGIKLTSFVAKKCREKNTLMPDLEKTGENEGYEGAIVLPPKCSMYMDNPVACVDYASLYPSSMISQNYSHDSKVWTKTYDLDGNLIKITGERDKEGNFIYDNLPGYQYIDIEFDNFKYIRKNPTSRAEKTKVGHMKCRWAQLPDNQKSIMPSILEELLKARKDTRKMIKTEKDPFMQNILDKRQLGYKVTANSLYGQCGARTSTFYEKDVAASTTATGRMMITYARKMIEEIYGDLVYDTKCHGPMKCKAEYIYGDTDSVFYTLNLEDPVTGEPIRGKKALEATIEISKDIEVVCSNYLKAPMFLEYEKTLMPFILLSKKRYVGMLYEDDPNKCYLKYMGLSIKRRDSCDYLKDVYGDILNILMKDNNIEGAIKYLEKSLLNLIEGNVPMDKLTITKALKSYYKNPNQIGHNVLANRIGQRDPGNKPKPGDRMKFVFIVNNNPKALMGDKIETPEYIIENKLQIDYTHYITNQLMKPLQQLFGLALEQIWTMQNKKSAIKTFQKDLRKLEDDEGHDFETFMKKKEKLCSAKIKVLLFDKVLSTIYNQKNKIQTLDTFFTRHK